MEKLELIKQPTSFKIFIPEDVEKKIKYLCQRIPYKEWSGTLFYTYEGSMEEEDLVITCKDIYVMDIGTSAYTEFDMSPDVISYMTEHMELLDCQMGLIHSHNQMSTFFSGTDTATLLTEGEDRNHFVSLIVNNAGVYTAGITRKITRTRDVHDCYSYQSFADEAVNNCEDYVEEFTSIEWFDLKVEKESVVMPFADLESRLEELNKKSTKPVSNYKADPWYKPKTIVSTTTPNNSLFADLDFDYSDVESSPIKEYKQSANKLSKEVINSVTTQLVTGSVASTLNNNLSNWVNGPMVSMFDKRFATIKEYKAWAEIFSEFLLFENIPEEFNRAEDQYIEALCGEVCTKLKMLPQNKYIRTLIEILKLWL